MSFLVHGTLKKHKAGKSPIILITGELGNGKTMAAIGLADLLNVKINGEKWSMDNIFHNVKKFVGKMYSAKNEILVFDEAGITLSSGEWWSKFNKAFYKIIQTQRFKNNIYIIVLPVAMSLAKDHRRMIDFKIQMVKKRVGKCWLVKKEWAKLSGDEIKSIWLGYLVFPVIEKGVVKEYKRVEKREKSAILDGIAKDLGIEKPMSLMKMIELWEKSVLEIIVVVEKIKEKPIFLKLDDYNKSKAN